MQSRWRKISLLPVALFLSFSPLKASTLQYSTYSTWQSAVANSFELDLTTISGSADYSTAAGKTLTGVAGHTSTAVTFTGPYSGGYQLSGGYYGNRNYVSLFGPTNGQGSILVSLPGTGANAVLVGLGSTGSATSITVTLSDGEAFVVPATANAIEFLGVSISHNITWLSLTSSSQTVVNDFYIGQSKLTQDPASAPSAEVGTFVLLGGGLVLLYGMRRRYGSAISAA